MGKKRNISDSDSELFRNSIGNVSMIKQDRVVLKTTKPHPVPKRHRVNEEIITNINIESSEKQHLESGDGLYFKRPGLQQRVMEKLRRGQIPVEKELDLHGMTVLDAETTLKRFLAICQQNDYRCIRIIHGKGLGSKDRKPVLKNKLNQWLKSSDRILAFCSTRPEHGGTGAVYVLLKGSF